MLAIVGGLCRVIPPAFIHQQFDSRDRNAVAVCRLAAQSNKGQRKILRQIIRDFQMLHKVFDIPKPRRRDIHVRTVAIGTEPVGAACQRKTVNDFPT